MANLTPQINLIKNKDISFLDKFIDWALTIGRFLVIMTEITALSAFIYRFSLDRKIIDLHGKIKQEQAIVNYLKTSEETFRNLQDRLSQAAMLGARGTSFLNTYNNLLSSTPSDVTINTFYLNKGRININATTQDSSSLNRFISALKNYTNTKTLSLDNIENKSTNATIVFSTTIILKDGEN